METTTDTQSETARPPAKDGRLKLSLRESAQKFLATKADLERAEGRELSQDEAMQLILAYVEISSPDAVSQHVSSTLRELQRYLDDHRDELASGCVEVFREALLDVMRGVMPAKALTEAIVYAKH